MELALKGLTLLKQLEPIIMQGEILAPDGQPTPPSSIRKLIAKQKTLAENTIVDGRFNGQFS